MTPLIITASICGREKSKADSPYFPATMAEVIEDGIKSFKAGVPQLHIHARDKDGNPTYNTEIFGAILDAFRTNCPNVILQISAGGTYQNAEELLIPLLKLKADVVSLSLQDKTEDSIALIKLFDEYNTLPIVECFSVEKLKEACRLFEKGYLKPPMRIEFLFEDKDMGRPFSILANELLEAHRLCSSLPGIVLSVCRGLYHQLPIQAMVTALGGHIRCGLEDKVKDNDGSYFKDSAAIVASVREIAVKINRDLADISQARKILGV
jgi:3-keto-5-aminohexanoate cleavage enzyme